VIPRGELHQEERDETIVYVCTLCGAVADPTPHQARPGAEGRDVCTTVMSAAGMARARRCVNGSAKAAAAWYGHAPFAPSVRQRSIKP
jgi:hypothetical protein